MEKEHGETSGDEVLRRLLKTPPQPKEAKERAEKPKRKTKEKPAK
tara:strand:- start:878 stop:1012 length:135 start_codon:yes stop_codon:yes gene_type:complete